jgi:hypothetical protein
MWDKGNLWTVGRLVGILGSRARSASWEIAESAGNDYAGNPSGLLEGWAKNRTRISGSRLIAAASECQLIDGEIRGFLESAATPWVVFRADDSTFWEIETADEEVLESVRASLPPA